jgi:hypothetical protein
MFPRFGLLFAAALALLPVLAVAPAKGMRHSRRQLARFTIFRTRPGSTTTIP